MKFPMFLLQHSCMNKKEAPSLENQFVDTVNFWVSHPVAPSALAVAKSEVQDAVHKRVAELIAWSMTCAASGVWPSQGFEGEEFPQNTLRSKMRGSKLANGWKFLGCKI